MNKVAEFKTMLNLINTIFNICLVLALVFFGGFGLVTANIPVIVIGVVVTFIAYVIKVLGFGISYSLIAIAQNTYAIAENTDNTEE